MEPFLFFSRRFIRIAPLYWLVSGLITVAALAVPTLLSSTVFSLPHVLASFVFVPYPHPVLHDPYPILVPGWSLNYEAFFYLLFGLSLFLPTRLSSLLALRDYVISISHGVVFAPTSTLSFLLL